MSARARILGPLAAFALLAPAAPAAAQALPPSLTADTGYAPFEIVKYDFTVTAGASVDDPHGAAIDPALDRHYAVGEAATVDEDIAIVARRADGSLDPTFAGDGTLALPITPGGRDLGTALVVLPDHRLRVVGATDAGPDLDVVVVGLLANGSLDPGFGVGGADGAGIVTFPVDPLLGGDDVPSRLALDPATGRLAIAGGTQSAASEDTFVAVLGADGSPADFGTDGVAVRDVGGAGVDDRGADVAWGARGPVALVQVTPGPNARSAALRGFTAAGDDDVAFSGDGALPVKPAGTDVVAGGLETYAGRLWIAGASDVAGDTDAYVARVEADGSGLQTRRFDMRGSVFQNTQVASEGLDLAIAAGEPDTLVIGGSVTTDAGSEWGAIAFNGLDGDLAALATGDLVIPVEGQGAAVGLAGGSGVVAVTGTLVDAPVSGGGSNDSSFGMARLLVDAEKLCDLSLRVVTPLELVMRGAAPGAVTLAAANTGKRACGGEITVPPPYVLAPAPLQTGKLAPGASVTLQAQVAYPARFPVGDTLPFSLDAPADGAPGDNVARVHVVFSFCDLQLAVEGAPRVLGNEGATRYDFSVRNVGTTACRATGIAVGGAGQRSGAVQRYTVPAGQSVTDEVRVAVRRGTPVGRRATLVFTAQARGEVQTGDNAARSAPIVLRPGDSNARRPSGGRRFAGRATAGGGAGVRKGAHKVARVEIAVRRSGKGCRWLSGRGGALRRVDAGAGGACDAPVWVPARGTTRWRLELRRALPKGRYVLMSRAVTAGGVAEGAFSRKDRNQVKFSIR